MQTVTEALTLLKRQAELEAAMKQSGDIRISEEQNSTSFAVNCNNSRRLCKP